jgi:diguanylate cyclase (GGDEF)-like protein/PAS domain S-box-containing protein
MIFKGLQDKDLQFFHCMLLRSNSPMLITDATALDNPIIFVNPAFEHLTGYTAIEAFGQNPRFLQGDDRQQPDRKLLADAIASNLPSECVLRNYRKNGELFWNHVYIFPVEDDQGRITNFVGIHHDVTAEGRLMSVLREKQRVIDTSPDVYLKITDDLTIVGANAACAAMFGWDASELIGKNATCLVPEERLAGAENVIRQLLQQHSPQKLCGEYLRKDGSKVVVEWTVIQSATREVLLLIGRDVAERRRVEGEAIRANAQVTSILDSIAEGCLSIDREWRCTYINSKGADWLLRQPVNLIGKNIWEEFADAVGGPFYETFHTAMDTHQYAQCDSFYETVGKWLEARAYPSEDGVTIFFLDISERKIQEQALIYSATHDSLTGLFNRNSCIEALTRRLSTESSQGLPLAVLFIDLDHFKEVNDAFGHRVGDLVLTHIGHKLLEFANDNCVPARISGDEFVVILSGACADAANDMAGMILESIAASVDIMGSEVTVGASIGITYASDASTSADDLINQADTAMYAAKSKGRHGITVFSADVDAWTSRRHMFRQEMLHALRCGQFVLHYQPQVSLIGNRVVGAEALIRWQHPEFGLLNPAAFIEIAEESALIIEMGAWVFDAACRQLAQWQMLGHSLKMSINVSVRQLTDRHLPEMMEQSVTTHGIHPGGVKLEVTESMLAQDFVVASEILGNLKQKGFWIALDDFGTGYSNLAYINRLPVTEIKIDRAFVNGIDTDKSALALINAIVVMAKSLNLNVVCEGIETPEQRAALEGTKCDTIQGYLVSKPLPAEAFHDAFLSVLGQSR